MNKQYEAYYSPNWACIWLFPSIIFIIDDFLILHKKETISVPLKEIKKLTSMMQTVHLI